MPARILLLVTIVVFVAAIVAGLKVLDSPATARERRFDMRRVDHLAEIDRAVRAQYALDGRLPHALSVVDRSQVTLVDPVTERPYDYRVIDDASYELCATFRHPARAAAREWRHDAGRHCFKRVATDDP